MNLCFLTYCNKKTGFGHFFRSLALAQTAQQRGHTVTIAGDRPPPGTSKGRRPPTGLPFIHLHDLSPGALVMALQSTKPDWLIVDLPGDLPEWIRELTTCRICVLNGIGYNQNDGANLRIIQSVTDIKLPGPQDQVPVLKGIEYIILRPELEKYRDMVRGGDWFVFGGGADSMNLATHFNLACPGWFASLIVTPMARTPVAIGPTQAVIRLDGGSNQMFDWMASSKAACVAMGMCVPELVYLRIPAFVLSLTSLHLQFAMGMSNAGLIKAWPKVGLPNREELRAFLEEEFEAPKETGLDLLGGQRVMEAIERL